MPTPAADWKPCQSTRAPCTCSYRARAKTSYLWSSTTGPASRRAACIGSGSSSTSELKGSTSVVGTVAGCAVAVTGSSGERVGSEVEDEALVPGARDADVHAVVGVAFVVVQQ